MSDFCHIGVKSEYSLTDGSMQLDNYLSHVKEAGHEYASLIDNAYLTGSFEFHDKCKTLGIKPIIGVSLYVAPSKPLQVLLDRWSNPPMREIVPVEITQALREIPPFNPVLFSLTFIAKNLNGFQCLSNLTSAAYTQGLNEDNAPICSWELLREHLNKGSLPHLVTLTGCGMGELTYHLRLHQCISELSITRPYLRHALSQLEGVTREYVEQLKALVMGQDLYMEVFNHHLGYEEKMKKRWHQLSKTESIPMVASSDAYYASRGDREAHFVFLAVKKKKEVSRTSLSGQNWRASFHLMEDLEFIAEFRDLDNAIANTLKIARQCEDFGWSEKKPQLPSFPLEVGASEYGTLKGLADRGLRVRVGTDCHEYEERLNFELSVIDDMGFSSYFLIVSDFVYWARNQGIAVGPGRGSGAGSLVAYCLGISDIDPLKWGLLFERFLNPERVSLPDFDIDFCKRRRGEVIDYVTNKYGADKIAHIGTFDRLMIKSALKSAATFLGVDHRKVDRLVHLFGSDSSLATLQEALDAAPEARSMISSDSSLQDAVTIAGKIEGKIKNASVHAAGVVISDRPITEVMPTCMVAGDSRVMTQCEMKVVESVGLVKFDFLGSITLTAVNDTQLLIRTSDPRFDVNRIPLDDPLAYKMIADGNTEGLFQAESYGMTELAFKLAPTHFEDIVALIALYRPGPLGSGMDRQFVANKLGQSKVEYLHPSLEPILKPTHGMIVYQEQVQRIACDLAGYSMGEADLLRRAMGKKNLEEMDKQRERFLSGSAKKGISPQVALKIYNHIAEFAKYGFNKSHSAAYARLLYITAYLKAHYSREFMVSMLNCHALKVRKYVGECVRMEIKVNYPSINYSQRHFSINPMGEIQYGFEVIKGMTKSAVDALLEGRGDRPFRDLLDLDRRVGLHNIGSGGLKLLIKAGAMDDFSHSREALLDEVTNMVSASRKRQKKVDKSRGQRTLMETMGFSSEEFDVNPPWFDRIINKSQGQSLRLKDYLDQRMLLGNYHGGHPLDCYPDVIAKACKCFDPPLDPALTEEEGLEVGGGDCYLVMFLEKSFKKKTKLGSPMVKLMLSRKTGDIEGVMYSKDGVTYPSIPEDNRVVIVKVRLVTAFKSSFARFVVSAVWDAKNLADR